MKKFIISVLLSALAIVGVTLSASAATVESGTIEVSWNKGYSVIAPTNGRSAYIGKDYVASARFSTTDVFTVPKAGTRISWSDNGSLASNAVLVISSWKQEGDKWVIDGDGAMFMGSSGKYNTCIETKKDGSGVVKYSYVTSKDNENLRICINSDGSTTHPTVSYSVTGEEGTWHEVQGEYPIDPGAPVPGATKVNNVSWYNGYVGSSTHSTAPNAITDGSSSYAYSSVFTVEKKGTTVYFYDDLGVDAAGTKHASSNVYGISTWKSSGGGWAIDLSGDNISFPKLSSKLVGDHMLYYFTTTKNNQSIRITYAAGLADSSLIIRPHAVWTAEEVVINSDIPTGVISTVDYKNAVGENTTFKIYLPNNYKELNSRAIFVFGKDTTLIENYAAKQRSDAVILYDGGAADASRLIEVAISSYKFNKYRVFAIGDKTVTDSCADKLAGFLNDTSGYASVDEITTALIESAIPYHSVLDGITLYAMGDSYFGGSSLGMENTWVNRMGDRYQMSFINYGIGGSTVSDYVTDRNPMVVRYKTMASGNPDVVLLEGGRNDRSQLVPEGTNESRDSKTFKGALNIMIDGMLERYPNAIIILVTPWRHTGAAASGLTNVSYANYMREIAEYRDDPRVSCLYAADYRETRVNMDDATFRLKYCVTPSDVSHLNLEGMKLVQPYMEKFIADRLTEYQEYLESENNPGGNPGGNPGDNPGGNPGDNPGDTPGGSQTPANTTAATTTASTTTATTVGKNEGGCEGGCDSRTGNEDAVLGMSAGLGIAALASIVVKSEEDKKKKKK